MKNNIEEYQKLLFELWEKLEDDLIDENEYSDIEDKWLLENGSNELFDYFIDLYKGRPVSNYYQNMEKKFNNKQK